MTITFYKMQGLGNDFMLIDQSAQSPAAAAQLENLILPHQIKRYADRHSGVGFDQLLLIQPPVPGEQAFLYRIFNADGTEVMQCGNGARCVGYYLFQSGQVQERVCYLRTAHGIMTVTLEDDGYITVDMGRPSFVPAEIPFIDSQLLLGEPVIAGAKVSLLGVVSMGNPHCVIQVNDVSAAPLETVGQALAQHPAFPQGVNVGFMQIQSRTLIKLRVLERGAGETLACGSGACAAVVVGRSNGLLDEKVRVQLPGGELIITWDTPNASVLMTGPAEIVFRGEID